MAKGAQEDGEKQVATGCDVTRRHATQLHSPAWPGERGRGREARRAEGGPGS